MRCYASVFRVQVLGGILEFRLLGTGFRQSFGFKLGLGDGLRSWGSILGFGSLFMWSIRAPISMSSFPRSHRKKRAASNIGKPFESPDISLLKNPSEI